MHGPAQRDEGGDGEVLRYVERGRTSGSRRTTIVVMTPDSPSARAARSMLQTKG